ncbi:hypothetical protein SAICODRAFT_71222 [Saitoella complicata NRRL Y-17804]|uniref:uncharacterized protein n=1 Tax=Saitoella complicata (strain BCRC 22490 / CBS 7301 / JCM 7358 / NBRC 10748 / NRRL Y-17804) TaxID=698492 RepID=UPI000866B3A4|nr:uncharacterized protein SAICODRAFT_71222 [Saitoella complicata NRRL Y-17804]ODQ53231.1 hypothetical protein SAICODRAFT_71222 [Saitoella complicata NRRL Y-17804]
MLAPKGTCRCAEDRTSFIALASRLASSCSISTSSDKQQAAGLILFKQYVVTSCRADQAAVVFASFQFALFSATFSYNCWTWYSTTETATAKREQRGPSRRQPYYDEFFKLPRLPRLPNMSPLKLASEDYPPETPPNTRKSVCPKDSPEGYQFPLGFSQLDSTNQVPVDSSRINVPPAHRFSEVKIGFSYTKTDPIYYIPDFGAVDNEQTEPFDAAKGLGC